MHGISASVVVEFCKLCGWAYEAWLNHRELFDKNPRMGELQKSWAGDALARLSVVSQEYALLQVVKLHDRAVVSGNVTLGIDYIINYGGWSDSVRTKLDGLANELNAFASPLRDVRNKSLSHNDLATIVAGATLGAFADGADDQYFNVLQEFVNTVHDQVVGGPWQFNDLVKNDAVAFMATIKP